MKRLFKMIEDLLETKQRIIVSIDGRCTAGKSTLANVLKEKYNAVVFHMDDYFLPEQMKTTERLSKAGGNVHYERMIEEIFLNLNQNSIGYQKFNCSTQELEPIKIINLSTLIIVEGVYSQQDALREYFDLNVFMTIEENVQKERLKKRNPKLYNRFINEWIPLEEEYFHKQEIESRSDITISI